jgi:hypothetical protein
VITSVCTIETVSTDRILSACIWGSGTLQIARGKERRLRCVLWDLVDSVYVPVLASSWRVGLWRCECNVNDEGVSGIHTRRRCARQYLFKVQVTAHARNSECQCYLHISTIYQRISDMLLPNWRIKLQRRIRIPDGQWTRDKNLMGDLIFIKSVRW